MKRTLPLLLLLFSSAVGLAQSSIVSASGNFTNSNIVSDWNLGGISNSKMSNNGISLNGGSLEGTYEVQITTSINEKTKMEISSYPNPVTDVMYVTCDRSLRMEVYLITGSLIKSEEIQLGTNTISTSDLMSGMYIIKFIDKSNKVVTKKIIKQ